MEVVVELLEYLSGFVPDSIVALITALIAWWKVSSSDNSKADRVFVLGDDCVLVRHTQKHDSGTTKRSKRSRKRSRSAN